MNSDTMMIVHVSADRKWATVVSIPRDSWVEIPACDKGDGSQSEPHDAKINEAFAIGGLGGEVSGAAACAVKTIEKASGLRMDHFISLDFLGFKGMVDAVGGVEVCPREPIDDKKANLKLDAGCQTLEGEQALGYVRARYSIGDGSDIGRIERQQEFMESLAKKAQSKLSNPKALYDFLDAVTKSLTTDKDLAGLKPLNDLVGELKGIPSDRITFLTVPNYPRGRDVPTDRANVLWQYPQADRLFTALARDQEVDKREMEKSAEETANVTPAQVRVRVFNGSDTTGKAAEVAEQLRAAGFQVLGTGNADQPVAATTITYPNGLKPKAEVLSGSVPGARTVQAEDGPAALTLTIGPDFQGVRGVRGSAGDARQ